jgi:hypothetical protein
MLLSIWLIRKLWEFILQSMRDLRKTPFYITRSQIKLCLWLMPTGVLRMLHSPKLLWNYLYLHLVLCQCIDLLGPLHWMSKCQKVTAGSSAEA